ncbi:MAG: RHS repeat-associated core domain-containing protein, partial [Bacteroidales bacterium]|nr:RHS repeat-associated core domain-containing protein [Bacteroidales bacterium]
MNQYYPYGDLISDSRVSSPSNDNRYRFTGKELATETGLYDFMARYLETSMGRFTTIDPLA